MNEIRALILCNNPVAIPSIREFVFHGKVAAIVTTNRNKEMQQVLNNLLRDTGVPVILVNKKEYGSQLKKTIGEHRVTVGILMTFPYIIPKEILELPEKGFINFHYGLLPYCRGPQPILWHLLNNDTETGVTIHKVDEGVDTGPVIMQEKIPIEDNDTYGTLQTKLAFLAAKQADNLLKILSFGKTIPAVPQKEELANYYEMPGEQQLSVNWQTMSAKQVQRLVNACNPWNKGAGAIINDWLIGLTAVEVVETDEHTAKDCGMILVADEEHGLLVRTADQKAISITIVYTNEGFFTGKRLVQFGIKAGMKFS